MTEDTSERPAYTKITRNHKGVDAEARRAERRGRLLQAGLATLGTKGYHATTVRDVCGASGLSERYFYESFRGLADLFDTIYRGMHQELMGRLMAILATTMQGGANAPLDTARIALSAWFTFLKEDPRRARVMLIDALGVNAGTMADAQHVGRDYVGANQAFIELLYPRINELGLSARMMSAILTGGFIYAAKEWAWADFEPSMEVVIKHLTVVFESLDAYYQKSLNGLSER